MLRFLLTVASFIICITYASAQKTIKYGDNATAGKYINIRGFKMYYEVYGKGEPLLFIHGNGGSINNFDNQVPCFAKKYKVILADSRAQGKSADLKDSLSYTMMADDLDALLNELHIKNAYVVGWSDGGINGVLLAMRHPDKVKKLAVTGTNLWPDTTALTPFCYNDIVNNDKKLLDSIKRTGEKPAVMNAYKVNHMMLLEPHIKLSELKNIKAPTLVIGGDHDVILTKHTVAIAENIPNSYLWIIPNSGHSTPVFKKEQFNTIVDDFFKKPFRKIEGSATYQ
jgi:pimeloyl-ACP methyl ester carboxylesterase